MIKVLENAIEKVKSLSEQEQRYAADVLEQIAASSGGDFYDDMTPEQHAHLNEAIAQADRGEGDEASVVFDRVAKRAAIPTG